MTFRRPSAENAMEQRIRSGALKYHPPAVTFVTARLQGAALELSADGHEGSTRGIRQGHQGYDDQMEPDWYSGKESVCSVKNARRRSGRQARWLRQVGTSGWVTPQG